MVLEANFVPTEPQWCCLNIFFGESVQECLRAGTTREKVTTNVAFPRKGLRLGPYGSEEAAAAAGGGWGDGGKSKKDKKEKKEREKERDGESDGDSGISGGGGGPEYDLYAVINHFGTLTGGHYTATCRAPGAPQPLTRPWRCILARPACETGYLFSCDTFSGGTALLVSQLHNRACCLQPHLAGTNQRLTALVWCRSL